MRELSIEITVDDAQAVQALSQVEQKMQATTAAAEATGRAIDRQTEQHKANATVISDSALALDRYIKNMILSGAAFAGLATAINRVGAFVWDSVQAYAEAERAQTRLTAALRAQGMATPAAIKAMGDYADQLSAASTYSTGAFKDTERLLLQYGVMPSKMKPALQSVADLASGLGIDLTQAAGLVGKALDGNTSSLGRYGVNIDKAAFAAKGADEVFKRIQDRFGGQAQADLDTYTGRVKSLKNAWDDLKESFGGAVVENPLTQLLGNNLERGAKSVTSARASGGGSLASTWASMFGPAAGMQTLVIGELEQLARGRNAAYEVERSKPHVSSPWSSFGLPAITSGFDVDAKFLESLKTKRRPNVIPFPQAGYDDPTMDPGYAAWLQRSRGPMATGVSPFPGWATPAPFSGQMEGGLPWASYGSMTATMHAPTAAPSLWSRLSGNKFASAGLGMLSGFIPGMSGTGSSIGSLAGSFLGPLGSILGGLGGGLIGKLFGGGEAGKVKKDRSAFIQDFGGMGELQKAADTAGFSLDKLLSTKKASEFTAEVQKLKDAMGAFDEKVQNANTELDGMKGQLADAQNELDGLLQKGEQLGYNFDKSGNLVSVSFEKMQEAAAKYGLTQDQLGQSFQNQRLHEMAGEIINDFQLLNLGGTDTGTILSGMAPKISELVNQSIKFGTDIPANMKPWIQNLIDAHKLTDDNGQQITDLTKIKFGEPVATEYEKIQGAIKDVITKMDELVGKIAEMVAQIDEMTRPRTVQVGVQLNDPNGYLNGDSGADQMSMGGIVQHPKYLSVGGFIPRGTDSVPAMLTPGEGVMRREAVSRLMRGDWPNGGGSTTFHIDNITVGSFQSEAEAEMQLGRALIKGMKRRGKRLNAA